MSTSYDQLLSKINEFTRKFYLNKLLRGSIYAASSILLAYLILFVCIYFSLPKPIVKTILFFSFLVYSAIATIFWVVKPALAYFRITESLSTEEAAKLIGNHFFSVKDKLLNTLQLKSLADQSPGHRDLIMAGIDQKISALRPIPFSTAINLKDNRKHIKFIIFPLSIIFGIAILAPAIWREGTSSFIRYDEEILPKAPFEFSLINKNLNVTQGDDLTIRLKLVGDQFPQDVYLEDGANSYKLSKENISTFSYTFKTLQQSKTIRFFGGGFNSLSHKISVRPRASLLQISATLNFPRYLNRKSEEMKQVGDLLIPEGTQVTWKLKTENSTALGFFLQNKSFTLSVKDDVAEISQRINNSGDYKIVPKNGFGTGKDSITHLINVIKDQSPAISVTESPDSLSTKAIYFSGSIADDYGFSRLHFSYSIKEDGKTVAQKQIPINFKTAQLEQSFFYLWNLKSIDLKPGQTVVYFFEVADNDGVNGAKIARSEIKTLQAPTKEDIANQLAAGSDALKKKMESTIKLASTIEKESKKLSQSLLEKKQISFEDKKQIENLLDKQKQLEEAVKEIKKQNEKNTLQKEENVDFSKEIQEKQKEIDKLFNNVLDEKTKDLLQKLQRLMEMNSKDQTRDELSKMQMDNKSLKNELDRILELYKQLEFEQNLQNQIDRLNELSKEQKSLSEQTKNEKNNPSSLLKKQDELNKEFKSIKEQLNQLEEKNKELNTKNSFQNPKDETKSIEQKQQKSKEQLQKENQKEAAKEQEDAAQQMEELANKMKEEQEENEEKQIDINAKELRRLIDNLLATSFEQEKVMLALRKIAANDPSYVNNVQQQNVIKDNMKTIADSLFSLSKKVPQLERNVNEEVDKITFNIDKSLEQLGERRTAEANRYQQTAMTSLNNLGLLLSEVSDNLQKSKSKASKKQKQGMQELQKMQEQLNKKMQEAKNKMEREGNKGTVPKGSMGEEFAKMAQQQRMIRESLQKINSEENKNGKGPLGNLNQSIQEMKQTENELINKRIEQETLNRQKNLLTKLLDADKAKREQDEDSKRESDAAKQFPPSYKQMLERFQKQQLSESELLQKLPPNLNFYYKNKIATYFKSLNNSRQ